MKERTSFLIVLVVLPLIIQISVLENNKAHAETYEINDRNITLALERALKKDPYVSAHLVDVETSNGFVTLTGTVENILEKDRASVVALSVTGIRGVNNSIKVSPVDKPDNAIHADVEKALLYDPALESYEINVSVNEGNVTLEGYVQSAVEKVLAAYVVKGVRGVRSVENRISVDYKLLRTDGEIKAEIERFLEMNPYINTDGIDITVEKGRVYIKGAVGSLSQKALIRSRSYVNGVLSVDDSGVVVRPGERKKETTAGNEIVPADQMLEDQIEKVFRQSPRLSPYDIEVDVDDRNVTLAGVAGNLKAKTEAEETARNTAGIRSVKNYIKVRPGDIPGDSEVLGRIKEALQRDPYVYRYEIDIKVENNKAYLQGKVNNRFEKEHVEDIISKVHGVIAIDNGLEVDNLWEWKLDSEIKENIEEEIFWDSGLEGADIKVDVQDGTAFLSGTVENYEDIETARRNAFEGGAKAVVNKLTVVTVRPEGL